MSDQVWVGIGIAVGSGVLLYIIKQFANFAARAMAMMVVDRIGDGLAERRAAEIRTALVPIEKKLDHNAKQIKEIKDEVTINSGSSLKDVVISTAKSVEAILTDGIGR